MRAVKKVGMFDSRETVAAKIPISEMIIDTYQGHVNRGIVNKIASNWSDSAAGAVILNMRDDNSYAVLDGQHRVLAAKQVGVTELNALVFIGKSREEEARLFVQLNTKHNVSSIDRFRARLESGEVREKTIRSLLREVGLEIGLNNQKKTPDTITCAAALVTIYDNFGVSHLKKTLGVLTSAFHDYPDRKKAYTQVAILGTAQFLYRYPEAEIPRVIDKLKTKSPTVLMAMGDAKTDAHSDLWVGWGRMMVDLYNTGMGVRNKGLLSREPMNKKAYSPASLERLRSPEMMEKRLRNLKQARAGIEKMTPAEVARRKASAERMKKINEERRQAKLQMTMNISKPLSSALAMAAKTIPAKKKRGKK